MDEIGCLCIDRYLLLNSLCIRFFKALAQSGYWLGKITSPNEILLAQIKTVVSDHE